MPLLCVYVISKSNLLKTYPPLQLLHAMGEFIYNYARGHAWLLQFPLK